MSDEIRIVTNHHPRPTLQAWDLTPAERAEFDYLDWEAIDNGEDSAEFFRYRGTLYDLGEFMTTSGLPEFNPLRKWHGYLSDSFFSGIVVRYLDPSDPDEIVVGLFLA